MTACNRYSLSEKGTEYAGREAFSTNQAIGLHTTCTLKQKTLFKASSQRMTLPQYLIQESEKDAAKMM